MFVSGTTRRTGALLPFLLLLVQPNEPFTVKIREIQILSGISVTTPWVEPPYLPGALEGTAPPASPLTTAEPMRTALA